MGSENPLPRPDYPRHQQRIVQGTKYRVASFEPNKSRQGSPEHTVSIKTAIRDENVKMEIES